MFKYLCLGKCRWSRGISQRNLIMIYKQMIRPTMEYASIVWGEAAKSSKQMLDTIQHRSLCKALGVMRIARKSEVNQEGKTWPLELRRWKFLLRQWRKFSKNLANIFWLKSDRKNQICSERSVSFFDQIFNLAEKIGMSSYQMSKLTDKEKDKLLNTI